MKPLNLAVWCAAIFLAANLFAHTVALRMVMLGVGVLLVAGTLVREHLQGAEPSINPIPPLWVPFALWAAWAGLSYFWSIEPERTLKEFRNEIGYGAAAFWLCWCTAQARGAGRIILPVVALGAVGACASALYYYFGTSLDAYAQGAHGGAGNHSSAIVTLVPCVVALSWLAQRHHWPRSHRLLPWLLAALLLSSGYTTLNRMLWLVIALQGIVLGALLVRLHVQRGDVKVSARMALRGALAVTAIAVAGIAMTAAVQGERFEAPASGTLAKDWRLVLWPKVIEQIREHPLTGFGFGRGTLRAEFREQLSEKNLWHSHNLILDMILQLGLIGTTLLGILFCFTLFIAWKFTLDSDDGVAACGIAVIAVVLGVITRNMTDVLWVRQNALLYWGVVGTLLALSQTRACGVRSPVRASA